MIETHIRHPVGERPLHVARDVRVPVLPNRDGRGRMGQRDQERAIARPERSGGLRHLFRDVPTLDLARSADLELDRCTHVHRVSLQESHASENRRWNRFLTAKRISFPPRMTERARRGSPAGLLLPVAVCAGLLVYALWPWLPFARAQ